MKQFVRYNPTAAFEQPFCFLNRPAAVQSDENECSRSRAASTFLSKIYCSALAYRTVSACAKRTCSMGSASARPSGFWSLASYELSVTIGWEWLLLALAAWGIRLGGGSIESVIGGRWLTAKQFGRDLGIGVLFLVGSNVLLAGLQAILRPGPNANIGRMLPRSATEITLWIFLSLSAGICEEFTFRGYLQQAVERLAEKCDGGRSDPGNHLWRSSRISGTEAGRDDYCAGQPLGWLAQWRKSTRPGMISHFLQDAIGGIVLGRH